ncbi:NAD-dependent epimerase/dehydratase family protein [Streptomyces sp. H10-C2]|uniref:NAD-dependent epimerase/dehydratase family protein n=1 Tax=unclassified Streptomyces TaxID=2593676 RepID=UPI0024BBCB46|nr:MULTISPECIES: NAD-dependent epimerase/dehydratase family protein [unclassified Streptomyces]MDJ0342166.1 NAD-dependent epimerase/dehydratase family protein [Streptomyces sp. PH10-H1]MDJ0368680.1 NAD-dependent epimerase/dehydratase family protein [Streptomyces sp. H10-C2]
MTRTAFVIGATGQVGRAAVRALAEDGWDVRAASRRGESDANWPDGVRTVVLDREDIAALETALGDGCDVLVDMVAYHAEHARQLTSLAGRIGSAVVISSGAVYEDDQGRSFDTQSGPDGFPHYPLPIPESYRTVTAGEATYGTRKVALEQGLLAAGESLPTTLVRAGAIHGTYNLRPRELFFIKRAVDKRPVRVLAHNGESRFHPVHTANLAELIRLAARTPGSRVLNAGDPQAPTVAEIGTAIDAVLGHSCETVLVEGPAPAENVGDSPWGIAHPVVYDMTAAERELGYRAVTSYQDSLAETVAWTVDRLGDRDWTEAFPEMYRTYGSHGDMFDYAAEDRWLAGRSG